MELRPNFNYKNSDTLALSKTFSFGDGLDKTSKDSEDFDTSQNKVTYLRVIADMNPNHVIIPKKIIWNDGREFLVEKVTDVRRGFVKNIGELCLKYYCFIDGNFRVLCLNDDMRWFSLQ